MNIGLGFTFESYLSLINSKTSLTLMEFKASSVHIIKCWSFTSEGRGFKSTLEAMTSILIKFECGWHRWQEMELEIKQSASLLMPSENVYDLSITPWERDQGPKWSMVIRTKIGRFWRFGRISVYPRTSWQFETVRCKNKRKIEKLGFLVII